MVSTFGLEKNIVEKKFCYAFFSWKSNDKNLNKCCPF